MWFEASKTSNIANSVLTGTPRASNLQVVLKVPVVPPFYSKVLHEYMQYSTVIGTAEDDSCVSSRKGLPVNLLTASHKLEALLSQTLVETWPTPLLRLILKALVSFGDELTKQSGIFSLLRYSQPQTQSEWSYPSRNRCTLTVWLADCDWETLLAWIILMVSDDHGWFRGSSWLGQEVKTKWVMRCGCRLTGMKRFIFRAFLFQRGIY